MPLLCQVLQAGWAARPLPNRASQRNSLPSAAAAEPPNELSSPVHAILGFPWIWCHKHWAVALLYKQERLPQIPKYLKRTGRDKSVLWVCLWSAVRSRGWCQWEVGEVCVSFGKWSLSEGWSLTRELWRLTLIFSGMFLNVFKQKRCRWLGSSCPAPAAPAVMGILLHVQVHPG